MKFHVNADCIGCGLCVSTCPEVFTMTDGGTAAAAPADVTGPDEATATMPCRPAPLARLNPLTADTFDRGLTNRNLGSIIKATDAGLAHPVE